MWAKTRCTFQRSLLQKLNVLTVREPVHMNYYHCQCKALLQLSLSSYNISNNSNSSSSSNVGSILFTQRRGIKWNIFSSSEDAEANLNLNRAKAVEEELPEIFVNEPVEVDDYIRPEQTIFEKLEDFWDWVISFMQPVEKQVEIMRSLRKNGVFGIDLGGWGNVFLFYGLIMRLLMLIPNLYSNRNSLRLSLVNPQLSEITRNEQKVKNDRTLSSAEKKVIREGYNRLRKSIYKQAKCAQWKNFFPMMTAPVTMSAFLSIRRLTMYETDLELAPFLWVRDLSMPDPTFILPAICSFMFLVNFELNARMQKGTRSSMFIYIRWGMRVGSVIGVYFFASQPSAMFAYWIGLSLTGMLQPLLLRWQPFRTYFAFPDPPQAARAEIISSINGPSLYEKLFASKEEKAHKEKERQEQRRALETKKFQVIDEYEIVLDSNAKR